MESIILCVARWFLACVCVKVHPINRMSRRLSHVCHMRINAVDFLKLIRTDRQRNIIITRYCNSLCYRASTLNNPNKNPIHTQEIFGKSNKTNAGYIQHLLVYTVVFQGMTLVVLMLCFIHWATNDGHSVNREKQGMSFLPPSTVLLCLIRVALDCGGRGKAFWVMVLLFLENKLKGLSYVALPRLFPVSYYFRPGSDGVGAGYPERGGGGGLGGGLKSILTSRKTEKAFWLSSSCRPFYALCLCFWILQVFSSFS